MNKLLQYLISETNVEHRVLPGLQKMQTVKPIVDPRGQWAHPGKITRIPSDNITMQGVPYPVYGVGSNGQQQMMYPEQEYDFGGASYVDEYPMMQFGGGPLLGPMIPMISKMAPKIASMFSGDPLKKFINWVNEPSETTTPTATPVEAPVRTYGWSDTQNEYRNRADDVYSGLKNNDKKLYNSSKPINLSSGRFRGAKVDPEMINDIVKAAKANNVDPWVMLSLVGRESTFGSGTLKNTLRAGNKQDLVSGWNVAEEYMPYEFSRFLADKQVPGVKVHKSNHGWQYEVQDKKAVDEYLKKNPQLIDSYYKKLEDTPDLGKLDSFTLAAQRIKKKGIQNYNPGDPKYPSMVNADMSLLKQDAELKAYMKSKGYREGGQLGSGLLSKTISCSNCGWSWKAVDGGIDPMTCHKCGGMVKMQVGGQKAANLQEYVEKFLDYPMSEAESTADKYTKPGEDQPDNLRHSLAGMYTRQAIQRKTGNIPILSSMLGFLGTTAAGLGHELIEPNRGTAKRPYTWGQTIREGAEDQFNNMVGSLIGSLPFMSETKKIETLKYLSDNNMLPDGYGRNVDNMYFKKQCGGMIPRAQDGRTIRAANGEFSCAANPRSDLRASAASVSGGSSDPLRDAKNDYWSKIKEDWQAQGVNKESFNNMYEDSLRAGPAFENPLSSQSFDPVTGKARPGTAGRLRYYKEAGYPLGARLTLEQIKNTALEQPKGIKGYNKLVKDDYPWGVSPYIPSKLKDGGYLPKMQMGRTLLQPITLQDMTNFFSLFSVPQKLVTKAVTGKYQTPSEAMDIKNPYGAFAVDAVLDPVNLVGAGLLGKMAKASTKTGVLSNAYKYNPLAFKPNSNAAYRMIGKEGYKDALESGVIRPPKGSFHTEAYYNKGYPLDKRLRNTSGRAGYEGPYMAEVNGMPESFVNDNVASYTGPMFDDPVIYSKTNIPINNSDVKFYKEDWLRGYKEVPKTIKEDATSLGQFLTQRTPLKNTYKVNPFSYQNNLPQNVMYRGLGKEGMEDALESGIFRAKQDVQPIMNGNFNMTKKFSKAYYSPKFNVADNYGDGFIAEVPRDASSWGKRYRSDWSQIAREDIPVNQGRILQKDWLQGYKEIKLPNKKSGGTIKAGKQSLEKKHGIKVTYKK